MGSRLRRTSIGFWSARLPTVSEIFATRAFQSSALARIRSRQPASIFPAQVSAQPGLYQINPQIHQGIPVRCI